MEKMTVRLRVMTKREERKTTWLIWTMMMMMKLIRLRFKTILIFWKTRLREKSLNKMMGMWKMSAQMKTDKCCLCQARELNCQSQPHPNLWKGTHNSPQ